MTRVAPDLTDTKATTSADGVPVRQPFDEATFAQLKSAEDRHFWFRARNSIIGTAVRLCLQDLQPGYSVLEVGCGNGNVLATLEELCADGSVTGIEVEASGAAIAARRCRCEVIPGDIDDLSSDRLFDVVSAFDVIEHVRDDVALLSAMRRHTRANGRLLLTVPAHPKLFSYWDDVSGHYRRYSRKSLTAAVNSSGFNVEWVSPIFAALFPAVLARRTRRAPVALSRNDILASELSVPGALVNSAAYRALRWESLLVRRRLALPFGSSYLLIARNPG